MIKPRDYQLDAVQAIISELRKEPTALCVGSTGLGKTEIMFWVIEELIRLNKNLTFVIVVNKVKLARQTHRRIKKALPFVDSKVYCASMGLKDTTGKVTIASIQSIHKIPLKPDVIFLDECFTPETEVLTNEGFVRFDELKSQKIAQVNEKTFEISFIEPIAKIVKEIDENILHIHSQKKINLKVTKNHDFLIQKRSGHWTKEKAKNISFKNYYEKIKNAGIGIGKEGDLTPFEKLAIAFQADGSQHTDVTISFGFSKKRKIKEFLELMDEGKFEFGEWKGYKNKRRFYVKTQKKMSKLISNYFNIENLSKEKARKIIEYMVKWDGHIINDNYYYYSSINKKNTDFYQAVSIISGYSTNLCIQKDNRKKSFSDIHRLFIDKNKDNFSLQKITKEEIHYKGKVYCVKVPDGNIIVRREGHPIVIGNCHGVNQSEGLYLNFYNQVLSKVPKAKLAAFTATPYRSDGLIYGPKKLFKRICFYRGLDWSIENGFLVPPRLKHSDCQFDTSKLKGYKDGDFKLVEIEKLTSDELKLEQQLDDALPRLEGRKKIVWATSSIRHCKDVTKALLKRGEFVSLIHSKQEKEVQNINTDYFENGNNRHLVFVSIVSEGYDYPPIDAVVLMRPTRSPTLMVQTIGRGLRPYKDKKDCLVLDYGQVIQNCGPIDNPYVKDERDKRKKSEVQIKQKFCPECYEYLPMNADWCPQCSYIFKEERDYQKNLTIVADESPLLSKEVETRIGKVEFVDYKSKAGNKCVLIRYWADALLSLPINEYIAVDKAKWKLRLRHYVLSSYGIDIQNNLNKLYGQSFETKGLVVVTKKNGKYDEIKELKRTRYSKSDSQLA